LSWQRGYYKDDQKVWLKVDDEKEKIALDNDHRAAMRYDDSDDAKIYSPNPSNVRLANQSGGEEEAYTRPDGGKPSTSDVPPNELRDLLPEDDSAVKVYTDGACSGNPGPSGYGFVVLDEGNYFEQSRFLGQGTNNTAELTAILESLEHLEDQRNRSIELYTDSRYSIGVLTKGWKAKANTALIDRIKTEIECFDSLSFHKVEGHAGHPFNERADDLATDSID
jgi:ribonuclease HI